MKGSLFALQNFQKVGGGVITSPTYSFRLKRLIYPKEVVPRHNATQSKSGHLGLGRPYKNELISNSVTWPIYFTGAYVEMTLSPPPGTAGIEYLNNSALESEVNPQGCDYGDIGYSELT
jgi:hypothetical protein